jgi:hypothetical protein
VACHIAQTTDSSKSPKGETIQMKQSTVKGDVVYCREIHLIKRYSNRCTPGICLLMIALTIGGGRPAFAQENSHILHGAAAPEIADTNKGPSELNHHIAGWALIGVGCLALASLFFPKLNTHYIWPSLFVLAGLYLALWSDGEIWPRGNLSWSWLLQHDAEAAQHKIYSVLLVAIGIVEHIRIRGSLSRFWKTWAFPTLAVIGAGMLLLHDHSGGSGARSPEAQAYLVNPSLDVDGSPRKPHQITVSAPAIQDQHHIMNQFSERAMDASSMESHSMPMDHSQMNMEKSTTGAHTSHSHFMTASMLRVEREHMWFMVIGLGIGLFKFVSDGGFARNRAIPYVWPACITLLGFMLVFYRE